MRELTAAISEGGIDNRRGVILRRRAPQAASRRRRGRRAIAGGRRLVAVDHVRHVEAVEHVPAAGLGVEGVDPLDGRGSSPGWSQM